MPVRLGLLLEELDHLGMSLDQLLLQAYLFLYLACQLLLNAMLAIWVLFASLFMAADVIVSHAFLAVLA